MLRTLLVFITWLVQNRNKLKPEVLQVETTLCPESRSAIESTLTRGALANQGSLPSQSV